MQRHRQLSAGKTQASKITGVRYPVMRPSVGPTRRGKAALDAFVEMLQSFNIQLALVRTRGLILFDARDVRTDPVLGLQPFSKAKARISNQRIASGPNSQCDVTGILRQIMLTITVE